MEITAPVEFGSALDLLHTAQIGDVIVVTRLLPNARYRSDRRVEVIGRLIGTTEQQTSIEDTAGEGGIDDVNEISKTTLHFEGGRALTLDWDADSVAGFVQVLS